MITPLKGDLIELIHMPNDPCPIEPGTRGTVTFVNKWDGNPFGDGSRGQVHVAWENGRTLSLLLNIDRFKIL